MLFWLMLLFVSLPLIELWLLIRVAATIELGPTILLVIVTGVVGAALARRQGLRTWVRVQQDLAAGRMPGTEIVDALLILVAGVVLITPGLVTDAIGFSLLVPPIRSWIKRKVGDHFRANIVVTHQGMTVNNGINHASSDGFVDVEASEARDLRNGSELP